MYYFVQVFVLFLHMNKVKKKQGFWRKLKNWIEELFEWEYLNIDTNNLIDICTFWKISQPCFPLWKSLLRLGRSWSKEITILREIHRMQTHYYVKVLYSFRRSFIADNGVGNATLIYRVICVHACTNSRAHSRTRVCTHMRIYIYIHIYIYTWCFYIYI